MRHAFDMKKHCAKNACVSHMRVHAFKVSQMNVLQTDMRLSHLAYYTNNCNNAINWKKHSPLSYVAQTLFDCLPDNVFEKLALLKKTIACTN